MGSKSITVASIPVTCADNSVNMVEVKVRYEAGGMNYFTYCESERGYYASVSPIKVEKHNGYETLSAEHKEVLAKLSAVEELLKD